MCEIQSGDIKIRNEMAIGSTYYKFPGDHFKCETKKTTLIPKQSIEKRLIKDYLETNFKLFDQNIFSIIEEYIYSNEEKYQYLVSHDGGLKDKWLISKSERRFDQIHGVCYINHFKSNELESISNYKNGKLHGKYVEYYLDGRIHIEGQYENGLKVGMWNEYLLNKTPIRQSQYKNGLLDGTSVMRFLNGEHHILFNYKDGKKDGDCVEYTEEGKIKRVVKFRDGEKANNCLIM